MQALLQAPSPLAAAKGLSPAQSLAVVDIFINAVLACICHTRELIPWDSNCFSARYIDDLNSDFWKNQLNEYSAFCDAEPSLQSGKSQEFRILRRGEDSRADRILDLIEIGVFSAVEGGFLEAVRFFITQGGTECHDIDVLESYTLTFTYNHGVVNSTSVRAVSSSTGSAFTTDNIIKSFKRAIKSLLMSLEGLPSMPRKRSLGVAMLYNSRWTPTYETPGFRTEAISPHVEELTGWQKLLLQKTGDLGEFEVGSYSVLVGASNVRNSVETPTSSQVRDWKTRKQLQSWQQSSSQPQNGPLSTLEDRESRNRHSTPGLGIRSTSELLVSASSPQVPPALSAANGSKSGRVVVATPSSRQKNLRSEKLAELILQATALEQHRQGDHIFDVQHLQQNKISRLGAVLGGVISCGCGDDRNSDSLLMCAFCGTSQHMECYGWVGFPRIKLPDVHLCYSCLLLPGEVELEAQMPTLISKRLAFAHVERNHTSSAIELMAAMHLSNTQEDHERFNSIVDSLQKSDYLSRRGLAIITTMNKTLVGMASREFVNPLAQISHHFYTLRDGENEQTRAKEIADAVRKQAFGQTNPPDETRIATAPSKGDSHTRDLSSRPHGSRKRGASATSISSTNETSHKRHKGSSEVLALERKASLCEALVSLDRSSPSTIFSMDEVLGEAAQVAASDVQWRMMRGR